MTQVKFRLVELKSQISREQKKRDNLYIIFLSEMQKLQNTLLKR